MIGHRVMILKMEKIRYKKETFLIECGEILAQVVQRW